MNTASNFCTASRASGEITADVLRRALEAMSANSKNLRRERPGGGSSIYAIVPAPEVAAYVKVKVVRSNYSIFDLHQNARPL
jgi:hypothetical protein